MTIGTYREHFLILVIIWCVVATGGCATSTPTSTPDAGGAVIEPVSADLDVGFKAARDAIRDVLRSKPIEIYTRDKRGEFVVHADMGRRLFTPRRLRLVIALKAVSENKTHVTISTFPEAYTVQLLTVPAWRPARFGDNGLANEILESVRKRLAERPPQ